MSDEKPRPRQLGRGLEALFGEDRTNIAAAEAAVEAGATAPFDHLLEPRASEQRRDFRAAAAGGSGGSGIGGRGAGAAGGRGGAPSRRATC